MIYKGEVYYADLNPVTGSEQGGVRPVVILQNDVGNQFSPTTIIAPMTTRWKSYVPMHIHLKERFLYRNTTLLLEQIRTIDKHRLIRKIGRLSDTNMKKIENVLDTNFYIQGEDD